MSVIWQEKTHGVLKRKTRADRTLALVFVGVVVAVTLLGAIYLSVVAANVRLSREIWQMEEEMMALERENQALMVEVARLSSIPVLQERSQTLGFRAAEEVIYFSLGEP